MSVFIDIINRIGLKKVIIAASVIAVIIVVPLARNAARHSGMQEYSFRFYSDTSLENRGSLTKKEVRWLPERFTVESAVDSYTRELLLGSMNRNMQLLFPRGTAVTSCFLRNNNLYLSLSADAAADMMSDYDFFSKCLLFEKNIFTNFKKFDKLYLYIDGTLVYESNYPVTEDAVNAALDNMSALK